MAAAATLPRMMPIIMPLLPLVEAASVGGVGVEGAGI